MNSSVRVLMIDMPPLLRQILEHAISQDSDFQLVPEAPAASATPVNTHSRVDAVIVGSEADDAARQASALLDRWPKAQVVVVTAAGRDAALYELRPHRTQLGTLSPVEAVTAIRDAVWRRRSSNGTSM
jgi:DNA-binding NarL/FixJ family response regulator